jgi:hypothetical protein
VWRTPLSLLRNDTSVHPGTKRAQGDGGPARPLHPGGTLSPHGFTAEESEPRKGGELCVLLFREIDQDQAS